MKQLKKGWVEGSVQEFLRLRDADMKSIEKKRAPAGHLRAVRRNGKDRPSS